MTPHGQSPTSAASISTAKIAAASSAAARQQSLELTFQPTLKRAQNILSAAGTPSSAGIHEILVRAEAEAEATLKRRISISAGTGSPSGGSSSLLPNITSDGNKKDMIDNEVVHMVYEQQGEREMLSRDGKSATTKVTNATVASNGRQWNLGASLRRKISEAGKSSGRAIKRSISARSARGLGGTSNGNGRSVGSSSSSSRSDGSNVRSNGSGSKHSRSFSDSQGRLVPISGVNVDASGVRLQLPVTHSPSSSRTNQQRNGARSLSSDICEASRDKAISKTQQKMAENIGIQDVKVPRLLQEGVVMTKVSAKKKKSTLFRIDPDEGYILWDSKKSGLIPIENIKEIRTGADVRYYREQFQLSSQYESKWLTIIYTADGRYKTLHIIAETTEVFSLWEHTLRALYAVRQQLMTGLGNTEARQNVWERKYWRGADLGNDKKLMFEEVVSLCRRLNLGFSREELMRRFTQADTKLRGYLDFDDFRRFVKLLKDRPEIRRIYKKLTEKGNQGDGVFDFNVFKMFMREHQKYTLDDQELESLFRRYTRETQDSVLPPTPPAVPTSTDSGPDPGPLNPEQSSDATTVTDSKPTSQLGISDNDATDVSKQDISTLVESTKTLKVTEEKPLSEIVMSLDAFTSFLMSADNSAFADQGKGVYHDMTRPLPEYYISSSHNTYLVGHQLVGNSTIEGYIRALLHSCRSVEIDIYDGETEPVIYHGKTLTSKVPLRDICVAIAKYAFVSSPYPIIISAEVHCGLVQQDLIAFIMREVFGDALVTAPTTSATCLTVDDPSKGLNIEHLPSPEELKGRVLLKAKNLYVTEQGLKEKSISVDTESSTGSSTETSASDSEFVHEVKTGLRHELDKARNVDAVKEIREEIQKPLQEMKQEISKAKNLMSGFRRKKSPSPLRRAQTTSNALGTQTSPSSSPPTKLAALPSAATLPATDAKKVRMSHALAGLLVYTVGVKCRGFNKKETYAPEHMFSLSERTANKVLKQSMMDLVKHNRTHLVRIYPNGLRLNSSNYEPHRYWAAGAQLVALNWQTFDLGYMINHSMFQRNGRAGYVLKPQILRNPSKEALTKFTKYYMDVTIISAQQLPRRKDSEGREIDSKNVVDPFVEVSVYVPDWVRCPYVPPDATPSFPTGTTMATTNSAITSNPSASSSPSRLPSSLPPSSSSLASSTATATAAATSSSTQAPMSNTTTTSVRTTVVKNNGFNPVWEESIRLPFCVPGAGGNESENDSGGAGTGGAGGGGLLDLVFVRFAVRDEDGDENDPLAVYCASVGSLMQGYRHLPLHDSQLSQYLFSTLFVHIDLHEA